MRMTIEAVMNKNYTQFMAQTLQIDTLNVHYADGPSAGPGSHAVRHLSLDLAAGDIACLLGPSGCGKSSLLRAIAGFVVPSTGRVLLNQRVLSDANQFLPPESRGIGMVFQDYALFPHLTVYENVLFGLSAGKPKQAGSEQRCRAEALLALVGLEAYQQRYPQELSGGQAQRVALARALAPSPGLILLDEPFSNLDHSLRVRLAREVREILKKAGTTAIVVTHDQTEAFAMADQLGVMFDGRLVQWDKPYVVYHEPSDAQVAKFIGDGAFVSGIQRFHSVDTPLGTLALAPCCCNESTPEKAVNVLLRPDDVVHDDHSPLQAKVVAKTFRGADFLYTLELSNGERVLSLVPSHHDHPLDQPIGIRLEADHVVTFAATEKPSAFEGEAPRDRAA